MDFLEAAFELCSFGWRVFPCAPGRKEPAIPKSEGGRGFMDATDDEDQIAEWARRFPNANVGIACGIQSNLTVLDLDVQHGAMASVKALEAEGCRFPSTVMVRTPSGGWHAYYAFTSGPKNSQSRLGEGIDIRTEGGYVVAPPSVRADGGWVWARRPLGGELPKLPKWAVDRLQPRQETPFYREPSREAGDTESLTRFVENGPSGQRNRMLHWAGMRAGEAVVRGELSQQQAVEDMIVAGMRAGLDRAEAGKTARSGVRRGMRA